MFGSQWQVRLGPLNTAAGAVVLRPIRSRDAKDWSRLRIKNRAQLEPWEPWGAVDWEQWHAASAWPPTCASLRTQARRGQLVPLVIEVDGKYVGQVTIGSISRGQLQSAWVGYWVDRDSTGRGVATAAVALAVDFAFSGLGLHRVEATVHPDNAASRAVLAHSGFREEGRLVRYLFVDGAWRDHILFGLTAEEQLGSLASRLVRAGRASF